MEDGPIIRLSRSLSLSDPEHMQEVMQQFASGMQLDTILESHKSRLEELKNRKGNHDRYGS